jgi:hypothetical protein
MRRSQQDIKKHFEEYIFGFIFNDIYGCMKARANYTVALALLSYTEYVGGLINGTLGLQGKSQEQFNKALEFFEWNGDGKYYRGFKQKYKDFDFQIKEGTIYTLFRCGLAHEYFIKGDSLVHNNPDGYRDSKGVFYCEGCIDSDAGVQVIDGRLRFHTNAYFRDFKNAVQKYYEKLIEGEDQNLLNVYNSAMDRIFVRELLMK